MLNINFADLVIWYVAFLFSFTAHEAAHALAAMRGGDFTAYLGGQATLNPLPHIKRSPFGTVVIPLISFFLFGWMIGWASAPYDPNWAARYPRKAALMAAAGPSANFVIAFFVFIIMKLGLASGIFTTPSPEQITFTTIVIASHGAWIGLAKLLSVFLMLNMILFVFNLFPVPPLDGSNVITLFMSEPFAYKYRKFMSQPAFALLGIVLAWRIFPFIFREIFFMVINLLHPNIY